MTTFAHPKFHPTKLSAGPGPLWLRSVLLGILAGLILVILVLAPATRSQLEAARVEGDSETVSPVNLAYGTRDPYGYGPRAAAQPGEPGGSADEENLSVKERAAEPTPPATETSK